MKDSNYIIRQRYFDPEQEEQLEKLKNELLAFAELKGEEDGRENMPVTEEQYKAHMHNHITVRVQQAIDQNQQRHQPVSGIVIANQYQNSATNTVNGIKKEISDDKFTLSTLNAEAEQLGKPLQPRWFKKAELAIACAFGVFEGIVLYDSLTAAGLTKIAIWGSSIIAVAIGAIGIHVGAGYIRKAKDNLQFKTRYAFMLAAGLGVSIFLGFLRADMYNSGVDVGLQTNDIALNSDMNVSAWALAALSFAAFGVALGFAVKYWKSNEEKRRENAYHEQCDKIEQLQNEMDAKENNIIEIEEKARQESAIALSRFEYAMSVESDLITFGRQLQQKYFEKVLRFRSDGLIPSFFVIPTPFQFKTFFEKVKK